MAEWKKVIVSGSNADLADVSASGNFLGNLIGNATGDLTGNADTATALANARTINGTSFDGTGNITLGNDSVTEAMMADNSIDSGAYVDASIDTAHIGDEQVTLAKLAHAAANTVLVRDANSTGDPSFKTVANTQLLIGDGTGFTAAALSGDVTMTNAGVVTIGAGTVENSMLADDAVGADELAANAVVNASIASGAAIAHSKLASLASTKVLVGNGSNVATGVALSGDVTMDNAGAVTIAAGAVERSMLADNAIDGDKLADDVTVAGALTVVGGATASHFSASTDIIASGNIITTSGSFVGSGAELTGITIDIDGLGTGTNLHQTQDYFIYSNNGTEQKITFSNVEDAIFGNVSGDATIAAGGALTIGTGVVEHAMLAADAVDGDNIADDSVDSEHYVDGSIDAAHIASNAVTTAKINADAVTGAKIADNAINSEHYTDGSIDAAHIASNAVTTAKINADAVTAAKLADDAVVTANIVDANVTTAKIAADAVTGAKIADNAIDSEHYTDGSIDTAHIANDAVTGAKLANDITIANDLTVTNDLIVNGDLVTVNTANLNIEDQFILINSGSSTATNESGIIFGGSNGAVGAGAALVWNGDYNSSDGRLAVANAVSWNDTSATVSYYVGGVFEGSEANAATAQADHKGNIRIESSEIFIYV